MNIRKLLTFSLMAAGLILLLGCKDKKNEKPSNNPRDGKYKTSPPRNW